MTNRTGPEINQRGRIDPRLIGEAAVVLVAILLVALVVWLSGGAPESETEPDAVPAPESAPAIDTVELAASGEERGDAARAIIETLRDSADGPDYAEALTQAREFLSEGRLADAQLLYFFAARGGDALAAFELATLYDPNQASGDANRLQESDPFQAFKLYQQAQEAGHEDADQRLAALRVWTEQASEAGDEQARRLLLLWESS